MGFTNTGLVAHAKKALNEKWFYGWGTYGQLATAALIESNIRQYPENAAWKTYMTVAVGKTRLCDCYGLVKSYLWWTSDGANPKYNNAQDRNTAGAYNAAKEKGTLSNMPEIPGIILYMQGHVGVYIGNGEFIELTGGGVGARKGTIKNGVVTSGSKFTHWFKDTFITYEAPKQNEIKTVDEAVKVLAIVKLKNGQALMNSPQYWADCAKKMSADEKINIEYLGQLIINFANYFKYSELS